MGFSPGGRQIKEGGHSTGEKKKDFVVYGGLTKALRTESVPLCDRPTRPSPLKVPLSFYLSHTLTSLPNIMQPNNPPAYLVGRLLMHAYGGVIVKESDTSETLKVYLGVKNVPCL